MKNIYKQLSIKQKLLMLFSIQIIIPLVFMSTMIYRSSSNIIKDKSIDYSVDILKMMELRFNDFSDDVSMGILDILYDPVVYDVLEQEGSSEEEFKNRDDLSNILRKVCLSHDEIQAIAIVSLDEEYYTYDSNSGRVGIKDQLDYESIHTMAKNGKGELTWFVSNEDELKNIYAIQSIYNNNDFTEIGTMVILIKTEEIESVYSDLSTEFMERIALVTMEGNYVVGTEELSKERLEQVLNQTPTSEPTYIIDEKSNTLISYRDVNHPSWKIVTEISLDKLNEDLGAFEETFIIIFIITLIILSLLSMFMAVDIVEPINNLVAAMRHMKDDKVHEEIIVDRKDELGYLSVCFNSMSEEIDVLVNQVYREQLTRKEAELKTLQAQINPHFLFNTLESINWMAMLNQVPEISDMVTALSSLMEAGIGKGMPMISLREELAFVDSYLVIMKNRYGERLTFEKEVDTSILNKKVPKLMLQPVIENAIYHGIDKRREPGLIKLNVFTIDNMIRIEVTDNGNGIEAEFLNPLNERLRKLDDSYLTKDSKDATENPLLVGNKTIGIGLLNVNRRIKLFYGQDYGVQLESIIGDFTRVIINLPLKDIKIGSDQLV